MTGIPTPWILVGITCTASALGSLMIYSDIVWNFCTGQHFSILNSNTFLGVALSLSAGTLLVTSVSALLPKSISYIEQAYPEMDPKRVNLIIVALFLLGGIACHIFNFIVLHFTSDSIVGCSHEIDSPVRRPAKMRSQAFEDSPLLNANIYNHGATDCDSHNSSEASLHAHDPEMLGELDNVHDFVTHQDHDHHPHEHHDHHNHDHHNHVSHEHRNHVSGHDYDDGAFNILSIGLQTTVGISFHRIPEGLLLFATSQTDSQLGMSLVMALSFHSFSEGFSIAAPLYTALGNRAKVLAIAIILGCGPQALGALIGSYFFTSSDSLTGQGHVHFALCIAATAGFMLMLAFQMVGAAFKYMPQRITINCVFAGCVISLGSRSL